MQSGAHGAEVAGEMDSVLWWNCVKVEVLAKGTGDRWSVCVDESGLKRQ